MTLIDVIEEQESLQTTTNRCRTLEEYGFSFLQIGMTTKDRSWGRMGMRKLIKDKLEQKKRIVWLDLGCGNGIALRMGKKYAEELNRKDDLLTIGVDTLPPDEEEVAYHVKKWHRSFPTYVLDEAYKPTFLQADIATVSFSELQAEPPDIITCESVLFWTQDPLLVFANAAQQVQIRGTLCISQLTCMHYTKNPESIFYDRDLITEASRYTNGILPGFTHHIPLTDTAVLTKTAEKDFTYGFELVSRKKTRMGPFDYLYVKKNI
ncbi:MAG: methyltransferase domain-containing protein [archaeon]